MILVPTGAYDRVGHHMRDDRLAELRDVMPTLLDLCDIPIPESVEGLSLLSDQRRNYLYCEHFEDDLAMRMIRADQYKLIWYPVGNRLQLFDLEVDPQEMQDLSERPECAGVRERLTSMLVDELYSSDLEWVRNGELVGLPDKEFQPSPNRGLSGQRGWR